MLNFITKSRVFFWVLANIAVQIFVPIIYFVYLMWLMDYEYENGIRTSSDGDSIMIPAAGMFVLIFFTLIVVNVFIAVAYFWIKYRATVSSPSRPRPPKTN
jgi:hypothetical protein